MSVVWEVPISEPPEVVALGRNAHGFEPVDRYCLPDLWSLHLYGYEAELKIDGMPLEIRPGYIGLTPPGKTMETRYKGISVHIYAHFRANGTTKSIPAMQDLGEQYDELHRRLYEMNGLASDQPTRVNARVWDVLWHLTTLQSNQAGAKAVHPVVAKATDRIAKNLSEPISIEALAQDVGVSYSYLARLFQATHGETVVAYIRRQRLERAVYLLERSNLPIKAIASSVGIPDLQHFNKLVRSEFGRSPRAIRHG